MPYFAGNYASVLKSCFSSVKRPDASAFSFVAAISSDGHVIRIYNNRETNIFACLRESLKDEVFPNPPVSPYYLHVDMSFNDDPPHQRVARLSPPLTVATKQNSSRSDCWHAESSTSIPRKDEMKEVDSPELREPPLIEKNVEWAPRRDYFPCDCSVAYLRKKLSDFHSGRLGSSATLIVRSRTMPSNLPAAPRSTGWLMSSDGA